MKNNINFIKLRIFCYIISILVILLGQWYLFGGYLTGNKKLDLGLLTPLGLNLSIDFQGGLVNQITVYSGISQEEIRQLAIESGLGNNVQRIIIPENKRIGKSESYLIKTMIDQNAQKIINSNPDMTASKYFEDGIKKLFDKINSKMGITDGKYILTGTELAKANSIYKDTKITGEIEEEKTTDKRVLQNVVKESQSVISPSYSAGLRLQAVFLVLFVLLIMLLYVTFRFKFKFGVGAILALIHDSLVMLGFISFMQIEFDYTILGAVLFIIGYSINDTIVVYDRIRENMGIMKDLSPKMIINSSINQTLSRTIITSFTTFLAALGLAVWGGPIIQGFAVSVIVGIVTGTYSSIFIAAPLVDSWDDIFGNKKEKERIKALEQKEKTVIVEKKQDIKEDNINNNDMSSESTNNLNNIGEKVIDNVVLSKKQLKKLAGKKKK
jgi:preprotein translocase SecF subunit